MYGANDANDANGKNEEYMNGAHFAAQLPAIPRMCGERFPIFTLI